MPFLFQGFCATLWTLNVVLYECGIGTFETFTRSTLELSSVLAVKRQSHLPVVVAPSHAWCDGAQSLTPNQFQEMMPKLASVAACVGRTLD